MSYELMLEYDRLATSHFEDKKKFEKLKDKENGKFHEMQMKHYDHLSYDILKNQNLNIAELYMKQTANNSRALRVTRYAHFNQWNTATIEEKERWGIDLVKMALQKSIKPVVSCSFGIDSIVTLYITRKALIELGRDPSEIQVVWNDTLNEFPEVRMFAKRLEKEWNLNLLIAKPKIPLKKIIEKNGGIDSSYFTARKGDRRNGQPLSEKCCGTLKHEPMKRAIKENKWDLVINGVRADESMQRKQSGLRDGEYFYSITEWKAFTCRPLLWWRESNLWEYVEKENIPYNELYDKNMIREYPVNFKNQIYLHKNEIEALEIDYIKLMNKELLTLNRKQANLLNKLGFDVFTPRTGCMACPIRVKYGYLHWIRLYYPKVYKTMVYNLGYGKALLDMIPEETKEEIQFVLGIDLNEENAHEFLKDIIEAKPCVFDKFD